MSPIDVPASPVETTAPAKSFEVDDEEAPRFCIPWHMLDIPMPPTIMGFMGMMIPGIPGSLIMLG